MTTTFLISEAKVRAFTDINNMVDTDLLKNNIRTAQDYYLQAIIGTLLYEKLLTDVDNGTLSGNYKTLVDAYIQDYLLYATYYESLESIYLRPRNNGLLRPNGGENSDPVDKDLYEMKRQSIYNKLSFYGEKLTDYIIEEQALFPELNQSNKLYEQNPNYETKYKNPFALRKSFYAEQALRMGLRIYNSRYPQYPQ